MSKEESKFEVGYILSYIHTINLDLEEKDIDINDVINITNPDRMTGGVIIYYKNKID